MGDRGGGRTNEKRDQLRARKGTRCAGDGRGESIKMVFRVRWGGIYGVPVKKVTKNLPLEGAFSNFQGSWWERA